MKLQGEAWAETESGSFCIYYLSVQKKPQSQHLFYSWFMITPDRTRVGQAFVWAYAC